MQGAPLDHAEAFDLAAHSPLIPNLALVRETPKVKDHLCPCRNIQRCFNREEDGKPAEHSWGMGGRVDTYRKDHHSWSDSCKGWTKQSHAVRAPTQDNILVED